MVLHDRIWRRRQEILAGKAYPDLTPGQRAEVARLLGAACHILESFGGTDRETLIRMCRDQQVSEQVNEWVAGIIATV